MPIIIQMFTRKALYEPNSIGVGAGLDPGAASLQCLWVGEDVRGERSGA